jgi:hypothetical protein
MLAVSREHEAIQSVSEAARNQWGASYRGVSLTPSALYGMDSLMLTLHADPCDIPSRESLACIIFQAVVAQKGLNRSISLHLGLPGMSLRLFSRDEGRRFRHGVLSRSFFSDALSLWAQPGFLLEGAASTVEAPVWTAWQEEYLLNWRCQRSWLPAAGLPDSLPDITSQFTFVCAWWKALQLLMIERSIHRGEVVYPLTVSAIGRALEREGMPLPPSLQAMEEAFVCELASRPIEISERIPEALAFLQTINAQVNNGLEYSPA